MLNDALTRSFIPGPENGRLLRDAFGRFMIGVTIVTTGTQEDCVAITANSFSSVSLDPPLVLWSPARASSRFDYFAKAETYAIQVLSADQSELAYAVAKNGWALSDEDLIVNGHGVPVLPRCLARFDCQRHSVHEAGDHAIVVGEVLEATMSDGLPLTFYAGKVARINIG